MRTQGHPGAQGPGLASGLLIGPKGKWARAQTGPAQMGTDPGQGQGRARPGPGTAQL